MIHFFSRPSILGLATLFSMMGISHTTQAQNIGPGNLSLNIDGAYVLNGESNSTGNSVVTGTALTGSVSVEGVQGNGGTTTVTCYDSLTGSTLFNWATQTGGGESFTWTPTTVGTHELYCSGTWEGQHVNGTVDTATDYIPVTGPISIFNPAYEVVSVLYSPPGNQSSNGYTDTTTNGSTTTIGSSFTNGSTITFSSGIKGIFESSASFGASATASNSNAFTETIADATGVATDDNSSSHYNPTATNAIDHNLDTFLILLNPQVTVTSNGSTPTTYSTGFQPITGIGTTEADIVEVPAIDLKSGTVGLGVLVPQAIGSPVGGQQSYMPGLGAICKNNAAYKNNSCTQANQCGCVASDFAGILAQDPLLNYNGTGQPYAGTVSPLEADTSGATDCLVPNSTDKCRYVIVPATPGSVTPAFEPLTGSTADTFTQTDTDTTTKTLGESTSYSVSISFQSGPLIASVKVADTWTWTNNESVGAINGTTNALTVTLKTSTSGCAENVNIYEDTLYHTYVYQVPTGINSCP